MSIRPRIAQPLRALARHVGTILFGAISVFFMRQFLAVDEFPTER
jgi:hypothetical protein